MFKTNFSLKFKRFSKVKMSQLPTSTVYTFLTTFAKVSFSRKIQSFKYLELVIKEAMRLYPPVPVIGRKIEEEMSLEDGRIVPAHSTFTINFFVMFRSPNVHSNAEVFNPERFIGDNTMESFNPFSYTPFSAGSRNCIVQILIASNFFLLIDNCFFRVRNSQCWKWRVPYQRYSDIMNCYLLEMNQFR